MTLCLGKPADVYLIDEPSAYLDSEQRLHAAKVIKRFILHAKKTAFIVEHDFIMATYLADRFVFAFCLVCYSVRMRIPNTEYARGWAAAVRKPCIALYILILAMIFDIGDIPTSLALYTALIN